MAAEGLVAKAQSEAASRELDSAARTVAATKSSFEAFRRVRSDQTREFSVAVEQLRNGLNVAMRSMEDLEIVAPISGVLTEVTVSPGSYAQQGDTLGRIEDRDTKRVSAELDEYFLSRTHSGLPVTLELGGESVTAHVSKVFPTVKASKFRVEIDDVPQSDGLRIGQSIPVRISYGTEKVAVQLPLGEYLRGFAGVVYVINEEGTRAIAREVTLGEKNDRAIQVISGLSVGETVITSSYDGFRRKDEVTIR